jgi:zinc transport system substrate-binding protein
VSCLALIIALGSGVASAQPKPTLKIGVTLHPYFSWTKNIVGDLPGYEVRSILPGEIDAGDYQPRPDDIKKLVDLDAIVINGIGHDDFVMPMLKASGNKTIVIIRPNETTPQIHAAHGASVNSHTFISFTNAI